MCLVAKIDNKEFMCFYRAGKLELRDENFSPKSPNPTDRILVRDTTKADWYEVSVENLKKMAETQMQEAINGLKKMYNR